MERLRRAGLRAWARDVGERFLDGVVHIMQSGQLPYSEVEAGGMPPARGRIPEERKPVVEEEPEQTSE